MGKRILVVDDDEDALALMRTILLDEGHEVFAASDVETAEQVVTENEDLEIIVLDVAMPHGLEGLSFLDWYFRRPARGHGRHAKIVVVTALALEAYDRVSRDGRVSAIIRKPFGIKELVAAIEGVSTDIGSGGHGAG